MGCRATAARASARLNLEWPVADFDVEIEKKRLAAT